MVLLRVCHKVVTRLFQPCFEEHGCCNLVFSVWEYISPDRCALLECHCCLSLWDTDYSNLTTYLLAINFVVGVFEMRIQVWGDLKYNVWLVCHHSL